MNAKASSKPDATAIEEVAGELLGSYLGDERGRRISQRYLPSREAIVEILGAVLDLMYPGYFGRQDLNADNLSAHVQRMAAALLPKLEHELEHCLCYGREREAVPPKLGECAPRAQQLADIFLRRLPEIRTLLIRDVQAAFDGDPAALNLDEIILAYPGVLAVSVYRIAHALYDLGVPMMARIMTEWAHSKTGCDIHPGASIGPAFFIDHATGVVIGETTHIGEGVKIYQGVTLGALSLPRDASGHIIRGKKRHPTVEDGATLYANATVLGGQTVVGAHSVIGGSVFLTFSVPPRSRVSLKEPELRVARRDGAAEPDAIYFDI
ncbi:MAG TPA: serine O-acetyltransferase [Steroidobacteraceae bacterium]|jgi:serine O-acetyltransferase|nr:serine O-acetyltransferase [Steroidobacteraceae bacterium]